MNNRTHPIADLKPTTPGIVLGIDASRNRSGGAKAHLIGIISEMEPAAHGIAVVHVWAPRELIDRLPGRPWLVKHSLPELERSLLHQLWWQGRDLARRARELGCDVLFATDASTVCPFSPLVVLSQDMLSYEPGVMRYFGLSLARVRLLVILAVQNLAFRRSAGVLFLTQYAADTIQASCGRLPHYAVVPHGVDQAFKDASVTSTWPDAAERPVKVVYVSNAAPYKHQWVVARAVHALVQRGHNLTMTFIGGGEGVAQQQLESTMRECDPQGRYLTQLDQVSHTQLPALLSSFNLFVFASTCENLPVTLLEAMAVGLPTACSKRGPMPEVMGDTGVYFDPESSDSIATAIEKLLNDPTLRTTLSLQARTRAGAFSWRKCAHDTAAFIAQTHQRLNRQP